MIDHVEKLKHHLQSAVDASIGRSEREVHHNGPYIDAVFFRELTQKNREEEGELSRIFLTVDTEPHSEADSAYPYAYIAVMISDDDRLFGQEPEAVKQLAEAIDQQLKVASDFVLRCDADNIIVQNNCTVKIEFERTLPPDVLASVRAAMKHKVDAADDGLARLTYTVDHLDTRFLQVGEALAKDEAAKGNLWKPDNVVTTNQGLEISARVHVAPSAIAIVGAQYGEGVISIEHGVETAEAIEKDPEAAANLRIAVEQAAAFYATMQATVDQQGLPIGQETVLRVEWSGDEPEGHAGLPTEITMPDVTDVCAVESPKVSSSAPSMA